MKRLLTILFILSSVASFSQSKQEFVKDSTIFRPQTTDGAIVYTRGVQYADTFRIVPRDTTWQPLRVGTATTPDGVSLYMWDGTKWNGVSGGGGGGVSSVGLTMPTGFSVANSPVTSSGTLAVTTTLNGILQGDGANTIGVVTIGTGLTYSAPTLSTTAWNITGNSNTTSASNFIGTTNAQGLRFRVGNTDAGWIDNSVSRNLSFGKNAFGQGVTGSLNTAYGSIALQDLTSGEGNTAIGYNSQQDVTEGSGNTSVGAQTFTRLITGSQNTAVGASALTFLGSEGGGTGLGDENTAIGYGALTTVSGGNRNIGIGSGAGGLTSILGDNNIVIGNSGELPSDTGSNQLNIQNIIYGIENSGTEADSTQGKIGIGIRHPEHKLDIMGDLRIQTITDGTEGVDSILVSDGGVVKKISPIISSVSLTDDYIGYGSASNTLTGDANFIRQGDSVFIIQENLETNLSTGLSIRNTTASTSGVPVQNSPSLRLRGNAWNLGGSGNDATAYWDIYTVPQSTFYDPDEPNARGTLTFKPNALPTPVMTLSYNGNLSTTYITAAGQVQGDYGAFNTVVGAQQLLGGLAYPSSQQTYRSTNGGSDLTPQMIISSVSNGDGNPAFSFDRDVGLGLGFLARNDQSPTTRLIMRANIFVTDLTNTAGSETGGLGFGTQTGGTASAERMRITPTGNVLINTTTDAPSSKLTIASTTQGFLAPRMTTAQKNAISSPAEGLLLYDTDINAASAYNGSTWENIVGYYETSTASSATPAPTGYARENWLDITALAVGATFAAPSGTPVNHNQLIIRVEDNGGAQTLAWNAIYRAGTNLALPTTTTAGKEMYIKFYYNSTATAWDLVSVLDGL